MSLEKEVGPQQVQLPPELERLVDRIVETAVARIEGSALKPFITCKECADLIGVTPEHLCAMRARGEGPPWSGAGKWTRYERRAVLTWLASLPREKNSSPIARDMSLEAERIADFEAREAKGQ
jgi:hypothetical protein